MKAFALYLAAAAILANVAGNVFANSAQGLQTAQENRIEKLCAANPIYCD